MAPTTATAAFAAVIDKRGPVAFVTCANFRRVAQPQIRSFFPPLARERFDLSQLSFFHNTSPFDGLVAAMAALMSAHSSSLNVPASLPAS